LERGGKRFDHTSSKVFVLNFEYLDFEFVSDFEFRASNLMAFSTFTFGEPNPSTN